MAACTARRWAGTPSSSRPDYFDRLITQLDAELPFSHMISLKRHSELSDARKTIAMQRRYWAAADDRDVVAGIGRCSNAVNAILSAGKPFESNRTKAPNFEDLVATRRADLALARRSLWGTPAFASSPGSCLLDDSQRPAVEPIDPYSRETLGGHVVARRHAAMYAMAGGAAEMSGGVLRPSSSAPSLASLPPPPPPLPPPPPPPPRSGGGSASPKHRNGLIRNGRPRRGDAADDGLYAALLNAVEAEGAPSGRGGDRGGGRGGGRPAACGADVSLVLAASAAFERRAFACEALRSGGLGVLGDGRYTSAAPSWAAEAWGEDLGGEGTGGAHAGARARLAVVRNASLRHTGRSTYVSCAASEPRSEVRLAADALRSLDQAEQRALVAHEERNAALMAASEAASLAAWEATSCCGQPVQPPVDASASAGGEKSTAPSQAPPKASKSPSPSKSSSHPRPASARGTVTKDKETLAATKLQAIKRGQSARSEAAAMRKGGTVTKDKETLAATKLQAIKRGQSARLEAAAMRKGGTVTVRAGSGGATGAVMRADEARAAPDPSACASEATHTALGTAAACASEATHTALGTADAPSCANRLRLLHRWSAAHGTHSPVGRGTIVDGTEILPPRRRKRWYMVVACLLRKRGGRDETVLVDLLEGTHVFRFGQTSTQQHGAVTSAPTARAPGFEVFDDVSAALARTVPMSARHVHAPRALIEAYVGGLPRVEDDGRAFFVQVTPIRLLANPYRYARMVEALFGSPLPAPMVPQPPASGAALGFGHPGYQTAHFSGAHAPRSAESEPSAPARTGDPVTDAFLEALDTSRHDPSALERAVAALAQSEYVEGNVVLARQPPHMVAKTPATLMSPADNAADAVGRAEAAGAWGSMYTRTSWAALGAPKALSGPVMSRAVPRAAGAGRLTGRSGRGALALREHARGRGGRA
jgi:hypothetical protein